MNRMQQQMMAVDPMEMQNQMMAAYRPAQISPDQSGGQMGMSVGGMQQALMQRKMRDAQTADRLKSEGALV